MFAMSLQIWAGGFYLLNKVFFAQSERSRHTHQRRAWRIRSWTAYLAGLPAWVVVFISEHNWIAAGVESGGAPAMLVGLHIAWRGQGTEPKWLDRVAKAAVLAGLVLSVYEFGGIKTPGQFLELGIAAGFLMGTYLMAKDNAQGYLWLMLGNVSCASLMGIEGFFLLMAQQLVSLVFVTDAFWVHSKKRIAEVNMLAAEPLQPCSSAGSGLLAPRNAIDERGCRCNGQKP